jgi:hypothetical protein
MCLKGRPPHPPPPAGNLLKVTEGPSAGKLALLDFGLVAEVPAPDREAMISATIHLANRDWGGACARGGRAAARRAPNAAALAAPRAAPPAAARRPPPRGGPGYPCASPLPPPAA